MLLALIASLAPALPAVAQEDGQQSEPVSVEELTGMPPEMVALMARMQDLDWQEGQVSVEGGIATIELPDGWRYLQSDDAQFIVEEVWGNPPDDTVLGFVAPADSDSWGVIVSFDDDGYVEDDDAAELDFDELLADMQAGAEEENKMREAAGYERVELLGWAERPHYDGVDKKIYWAKRLQFSSEDTETLNYNVRVLGRKGVLVMNAVAPGDELAAVAEGCKQLLAGTSFTEGNRYSDFDSTMDKVAVYGIGGLIAGKVLLKAGILAKFGKLIVVGVVGLFAAARRLFRGKPDGKREGRLES